jgi:choline dehydrogenase-like flavoprotein
VLVFEVAVVCYMKSNTFCLCVQTLGGSSALNVMLVHRGSASDYQGWADATGSTEWGPKAVLNYFKRSEVR